MTLIAPPPEVKEPKAYAPRAAERSAGRAVTWGFVVP